MRANNSNNLLKVILCFLIILIVTVIGIFVIKTTVGGKDKKDDKKAQSPQTDSSQQANDTTVSVIEGETAQSSPQPGESSETTTTTPSETTTTAPSETTTTTPSETTTTAPSEATTTAPSEATTSTQSSAAEWQSTLGSTEVAVPANAPKSYTEFSLTKGMSAQEAYTYLDSFLNSKYSILLNKQNKVASSYAPDDLITPQGCSYPMERVAGTALVQLLNAAKQNGIYDLVLYSGYRTVASQKNKFVTRTQKYLNQGYSQADAEAKAGEYIAPPGASEHHTGLAADVCSSSVVNKFGYLDDSFDTTASYQWMKANCAEYGFIIRYTKGDEGITGYSYEPWHLRYIGKEHAKACTELGFTYEEYHAMLIQLRNSAK